MRHYLTPCALLLSAVTCVSGFAGQGGRLKVYAPVPLRLRPRLDERLRLYVGLERTRQYEKLYDLFSESYLTHLKTFHRGSKSEYVTSRRGMVEAGLRVVDFTPTSTQRTGDGAYIIYGRMKSRWGGSFQEDKASVEARRQNGEWYFSELSVEIEQE